MARTVGTGQSLLCETFRYRLEEYWAIRMDALSAAGSDPVGRIVALVFARLDPPLLTHQNPAFWKSFWTEASANVSLNEVSEQYDAERQAAQPSLCEDTKDLFADSIWMPRTVAHVLETMAGGVWSRLHYSPEYKSAKQARVAAGTLLSVIFPSRTAEIMKRASDCPDN